MKIFVRNEDGIEEEIDASIIRLEKDDIIVLKSKNDKVEFKSVHRLADSLKEHFSNNRIVILNKDVDLSILRS